MLAGGADWLIVNEANEAQELRALGLQCPIYVCGPFRAADVPLMIECQVRVAVASPEVVHELSQIGAAAGVQIPVHVKLETGCNRQGVALKAVVDVVRSIWEAEGVVFEGISTHYADVEDTTDHGFAREQLHLFNQCVDRLNEAGYKPRIVHSANSAAAILWPETHADLVRVGIAAYGLWPSRETYATALQVHAAGDGGFVPRLQPALSWYTRVAQIKDVEAGSFVGYGRTYRTTHDARIAVLPVGYYEGYSRRLSNSAHVLVNGMRAPVRGRVCMNMTMIDVTHIPGVELGTVVTLLGEDGDETVTAENVAGWAETINYEIVSGIHPSIPRIEDPRG
jgi:alanine racemase